MKFNAEKLKIIVKDLFERSAAREYNNDSVWKDPKKRKFILIGGAVGIVVLGALLTPSGPTYTPRVKKTTDYQLTVDDVTGNQKRQTPTEVFSTVGADRLEQTSSERLMEAMEAEMRDRNEKISAKEKMLQDEAIKLEDEMTRIQLQSAELKRSHELELANITDAINNGADIETLLPGVKRNIKTASLDNQPVQAGTAPATSFNQGTGNIHNVGSKAQRNGQALIPPTPTRAGNVMQGGMRVLNQSGSFRIATGQIHDLNANSNVNQSGSPVPNGQAGSQAASNDVFTQLALAQEKLRTKRESEIARVAEIEEKEEAEAERIRNTVPLTAGSIITGTLLNGMYVPTASNTSSEPMPGLFRIKKEAIMPNFNISDEVVECIIVASARPAVESTRVIFRASTITCIRDDGVATEDSLIAISSGRDGITGVPATLVSKNSEMLMKTATAGFLQGLTDILSKTSLEVNSEEGVFAISGAQLAQLSGSAAIAGAGSALERLANYYMAIADKMQPTLEVLPGVEVDFLVTSLSVLDFNQK